MMGYILKYTARIACVIALSACAVNHMNTGVNYYFNKQYSLAVDSLTLELDQNKTNIDALLIRGSSYYYLKKLDLAGADYKTVIALAPDNSQGYFNYGLVLDDLGSHEDAIIQYKKAIKLNPDDASAFYNMGNSYASVGAFGEAEKCFEKAIALNPKHPYAQNNLDIVRAKKEGSKE